MRHIQMVETCADAGPIANMVLHGGRDTRESMSLAHGFTAWCHPAVAVVNRLREFSTRTPPSSHFAAQRGAQGHYYQ